MKWNARFWALAGLCLAAVPAVCAQQTATVEWDPNAEPGVAGYRVYSGTSSRQYDSFVEVVAPATRASVNLPQSGARYYFAVTAFAADGLESPFSEEVSVIAVELLEDSSQVIRLSGSDPSPGSFSLLNAPAHGDLSGVAPEASYSADPHYFGRDRFDFAELFDGGSNMLAVLLNVLPVNDRPTLNAIANVSVPANAGPQVVTLTGITAGPSNEAPVVSVTATSSAPSIVPDPTINYAAPATQGTLTFAPAPGAVGTATIVVVVNDGDSANATFSRAFNVTVTSPPPSPVTIGNVHLSSRDARTLVIGFTTDRAAAGAVEFGFTPALGAVTGPGPVGTIHAIALTNLVAGTNYYLRPRAVDQTNVSVGTTMTSQTAPVMVEMWSAESGTLTVPTTIAEDDSAIGGSYVVSMAENSGAATFPLQVPVFSRYYLWARVQSLSSPAWMLASVENSSVVFDAGGPEGAWRWIPLRSSNSVWAPLLDAAAHQFVFSNATAGVQLDELIFSTDPLWRPGIEGSAPFLAAVRTGSEVGLGWTDSVVNEEGFAIEISTNGTDFVLLDSVPASITNYTHANAGGFPFYYRVYAFNDSDRTSFSNVASVSAPEIPAVPAAPAMISAEVKGRMKITVEWNDNSADETGFVVERSTDGSVFETVLTVPANTMQARDSLDSVGTCYYRVRAFNSAGSSPPSNVAVVEVTTSPKN